MTNARTYSTLFALAATTFNLAMGCAPVSSQTAAPPTRPPAGAVAVTLDVDAAEGQHPISPEIYGVAFADPESLRALNCPLNRQGGNGATCYNWKLNASNHASDWYFESIAEKSSQPGEMGDTFIANSRAGGAEPMLTIPLIGWAASVGPDRAKLASFSIKKYGPQTGSDHQWYPDAGNGILASTHKEVQGNDPHDANVAADSHFQQEWVRHLVQKWGPAQKGGLRYYLMDNEPSIWQGTHRDVHPVGPTMEGIRDRIIDFGSRVKEVDPGALIVAPEEWGWTGYIYSGYDQQYGKNHGWRNLPDKAKHGGMDYLPWLLDQIHKHDQRTGKRTLDVFTVHYYPQGGEGGDSVTPEIQLRRNRSTRSLWDPDYVDESWIHERVRLVPRLKDWVHTYYPGLRTGITEYNWGAEKHINGATAQADILGIFGREGLDIATRWTTPGKETPVFRAIQMYRNYDGKRSTFGDSSVAAAAPDPDNLSVFAALRKGDHALTIMLIHKRLDHTSPVSVDLKHFTPTGPAQVWQLTGANTIASLPAIPVDGGRVPITLPAQSITLLVLPGT